MPSPFSIEVDPALDLVRIVMTGLLLPEHVSDFFEARRTAHAMLNCPPGRHVTLTDLRSVKIMPQETVAAFGTLLTKRESRARRLAFVVSATLVRNQLVRALAGRDSRCFDDMTQAEAWLLEEDDITRQARFRREAARDKAPYLRSIG
jgi:hypothetical protein